MTFSSSYVKLCIRMRLSWIWKWEWKSVTFSRSLSQPNDHVGFARPGCQRDGPVAGLSPVVNLRFWTFIAPVYWQTNKDAHGLEIVTLRRIFFWLDQRRAKTKVYSFFEKSVNRSAPCEKEGPHFFGKSVKVQRLEPLPSRKRKITVPMCTLSRKRKSKMRVK